jgi:hypothetical protein
MRKSISILVVLIILCLTFISCTSPYPKETTINEAEKLIKVTLPVPTYLPEDYEIYKLFMIEENVVLIVIKNTTNTDTQSPDPHLPPTAGEMKMQIAWHAKGGPFGIKLLGEQVDISEGPGVYSKGVIDDHNDYIDLWWDWGPDPEWSTPAFFEFRLSANRNVPKEEIVKIARSVRQLYKIGDYTASIIYPEKILYIPSFLIQRTTLTIATPVFNFLFYHKGRGLLTRIITTP